MTIKLSPAEMDRLSQIAVQLSQNDKTRRQFAHLVKEVHPAAAKSFSDVFLRDELAAFKAGFENERLQEKMTAAAQAQDAKKRKIITERGYSDDQVKQIDGLLTEYGFSDFEAGADIYAARTPSNVDDVAPPPEVLGGPSWEFPTVPGPDGKMLEFGDYIKDPRKYSNATAWQMITEFKRSTLPRRFSAR